MQEVGEEEGPLFPEHNPNVVRVKSLPRWSSSKPLFEDEEKTTKSDKVRIPFDNEINSKIALWRGDILKLDADAIVNSTNESLNEKNGFSENLVKLAGPEMAKELTFLEGCRTGEAKITGAYALPSRYVIHTVGPRYNLKYKTAAESALHNCYRNSMELLKEYNLSVIAFHVINSTRRSYPPEQGCHMALRTVRRFLENYGNGIETVVFVMTDDDDMKAYENLLPLYFPRSLTEANNAALLLPDDLGNTMGEPVQEERKIRIQDIPGQNSRLNVSVVSEDDPLRNWADPTREAQEEALPDFAKMQGDHDTARREEINRNPSKADQAQAKYLRLLRKSKTENLTDVTSKNLIYQSGVDSMGRPIICVNGKYYRSNEIDRERTLLYLINYLDGVASKDYVVIYFNSEATSENHPELSFVRECYSSLHPKYKRNLKLLYIVHPTLWVKFSVTLMNTFFTSDIREKIKNIESLSILYEHISPQQLVVPEYVTNFDRKEFGSSQAPAHVNEEDL